MKISDKGLALIRRFEGCCLTAYKCPAGVWTIGYGHTGTVDGKAICKGMKITGAKAVELLAADCAKFESRVSKYGPWNQNEFDALVSFAFNVGSIAQLTASGKRSRAEIAAAMLRYNKAGGKVLAGLTRRRKAESELFLTAVSDTRVLAVQEWLNSYLSGLWGPLTEDGIPGLKTQKAAVAAAQRAINDDYDGKLAVDGDWGKKSQAACPNLREGDEGPLVGVLQCLLYLESYDPRGIDSSFGTWTDVSVREFQADRGLAVDGVAGKGTFTKLLV